MQYDMRAAIPNETGSILITLKCAVKKGIGIYCKNQEIPSLYEAVLEDSLRETTSDD